MTEDQMAEALIGDEAKKFVESDLGQTLIGMAAQEIEAAQLALETVNPTDVPAIEALQRQAKFGRSFEGWLIELITKGEHALEIARHESKE